MTMMTWLADVLRAAGLQVEEVDGWKTRGRGEMGTVRGILCHHTGGAAKGDAPSLNLVVNGRTDLAGPLSQLVLARSGKFIVVAAGRCNHAGEGTWQGVTAGNSSFIGIEAENMGTAADPWPKAQVDAYIAGCAAILKHIGADDVMVAGHREYATPRGRKIDPLFDMTVFREQVERIMRLTPGAMVPAVKHEVPEVDPIRLMLRKGDQGASVKLLQEKLIAWFATLQIAGAPKIIADGAFGPMTKLAVEQFQHKNGLVVDGAVGPKTWKVLVG